MPNVGSSVFEDEKYRQELYEQFSDFPPLHIAVVTDNLFDVIQLLKAGVDVNEKHLDWTPLMLVKTLEVARLLVKHGANPSIRSPQGENSVEMAIYYNQLELVKFFIEEAEFDSERSIELAYDYARKYKSNYPSIFKYVQSIWNFHKSKKLFTKL